ncbi:MAG TPA: hypothetical protein IAA57_04585 [Candidatus Pullilachnospira intestinigallinarum]|nr:hypothetical protein [Candidatus Pullilachnospira intestinigallinarum]
MTDLHIHILPGLDDGADSWEDALEMAQMAVESGVEIMAATSHANLPEGNRKQYRESERYLGVLEQFQKLLAREKIPLRVCGGMEIFAVGDYLERLLKGELLTLNQTSYVLAEFPMDCQAAMIYRAVQQMEQAGYRPVLAHPERYLCVQQVPAHVYEWYTMGAVIQMNKGSLLGRFGERSRRTADSLLRHGLVCAAASDAHRPYIRTPRLEELWETLADRYGERTAWLLLEENPARILAGRSIRKEQPLPYDYS